MGFFLMKNTRIYQLVKTYLPELILSGIVLATRIPFVTKYLYNWDSVQIALAMHHFDLSHHQPHPLGYILYVASAKLLSLFSLDDNTALCAVSIIATLILVILCYRFSLLLFKSRTAAFFFACVVTTSPYIWFHGEVALSYIFDALFSIFFGYLSFTVLKSNKPHSLALFSFFLGLSGGFRETIILFFIPLWILTLFLFFKNKIYSIQKIFSHILLFFFGISIWCIPLFILSGGIQNYFSLNISYFTFTAQRTSILLGVPQSAALAQIKNVLQVSSALLHVLLGVFLLFLFQKIRKKTSSILYSLPQLTLLFSVWILPSLLFYLFIHFGHMGYLMTIAPPLLFVFLLPLLLLLGTPYRMVGIFCISGIILIQIFHFSTEYRIPHILKKITPHWALLTNSSLKKHDRLVEDYIVSTRAFDPRTTLLFTESGFYYHSPKDAVPIRNTVEFFRHAQYYLPEYDLYQLMWDHAQGVFFSKNQKPFSVLRENPITISPSIQRILIFADGITTDDRSKNIIHEIRLDSGKKLYIFDFNDKKIIFYHGYIFKKK